MKKRLFHKFGKRDFNEYYYALIQGDVYYGVSSVYYYQTKLMGIKVNLQEEQYFHTMKVPAVIMVLLSQFTELKEKFNVDEVREKLHADLLNNAIEEEHKLDKENEKLVQLNAQQRTMVNDMFYLDWEHPLIKDYKKKGWKFVQTEYAGKATRNIWLARTHEDLISVISVKLFGDAKSSEVIDIKRILMDTELVEDFVKSTTESR